MFYSDYILLIDHDMYHKILHLYHHSHEIIAKQFFNILQNLDGLYHLKNYYQLIPLFTFLYNLKMFLNKYPLLNT